MWHVSTGGQYCCTPPTQAPFWQTSFRLQNLPSSQLAPSFAGALTQVPLTQLPTLHASSAPEHSSFVVHGPIMPLPVELVAVDIVPVVVASPPPVLVVALRPPPGPPPPPVGFCTLAAQAMKVTGRLSNTAK
jgi:hypothetical protein